MVFSNQAFDLLQGLRDHISADRDRNDKQTLELYRANKDALRKAHLCPLQGIDLNAVDEQLPVKMWASGATCTANDTDDLSRRHNITNFDDNIRNKVRSNIQRRAA